MLTAFSVHRLLSQKVLALCKLTVKLVVKVVSICQHNNGGTVESLLQQMSVEHHRQRFSAALCMPEHTALTVGHSSVFGGFDCLSNRKILMVSCKNFERVYSLIREADKVLNNIKQSFFLEHSLKESVKLSILRILIIAVFGFPLHKTVFA